MLFGMKGELMKLKALKSFEKMIDATIGRTRNEGEIFEVDKDRAKILLEHNLVEEVVEEIVEKPKKETPKKKKSK